ncbi:MAG: Tail-specific protease [Chlamydiae bacterium]|nr:Tail-specific protease [Chlamydiota bacterium]
MGESHPPPLAQKQLWILLEGLGDKWDLIGIENSMFRTATFLFVFLLSFLYGAKPPEIDSQDALDMLKEIMESHASHKSFSPLLVGRALQNFVDDLDPTKTYFLEDEISCWSSPEEEVVRKVLSEVEKGDFSSFQKIQKQMILAIERRHQIDVVPSLLSPLTVEEFKELPWAKTEEELADRLAALRALQEQAVKRLDDETRERALLRIAKRRSAHEENIANQDLQDRMRFMLAQVLKAFSTSFDAHTAYFTPSEAYQFMVQVQQRLLGVGAQLRDDLNGFTVVKVIEGGPSSKTELQVNDRIIAVNKEPVVGLEVHDVVELLRGEEGTPVMVTVLRKGDEGEVKRKIEIIRGEVVIQDARLKTQTIPYGDGVIAHMGLHAFYQDPVHSSSSDLLQEIKKIEKEKNLKGIVLDLRSNSGGVLPQAVAVTGLFITKGIVVSIKDNNSTVEHLRDIDGKVAYDGPLVVLTSKASASAAEIVAQTLQDYGRAIIVGDEHTYGKGTFQTFSLDAASNGKINPKGEFKVTRGRYYTVSGKSPQLVGVQPDIAIPGMFSTMEIGEQYATNPLENDSIPENFHDDLSDIPIIQREQISWLYRYNLQSKLTHYSDHLSTLKANSQMRLEQSHLYKRFLSLLEDEEIKPAEFKLYSQHDPQLQESIEILKDLIILLK